MDNANPLPITEAILHMAANREDAYSAAAMVYGAPTDPAAVAWALATHQVDLAALRAAALQVLEIRYRRDEGYLTSPVLERRAAATMRGLLSPLDTNRS